MAKNYLHVAGGGVERWRINICIKRKNKILWDEAITVPREAIRQTHR
jgi:hypothetical protein